MNTLLSSCLVTSNSPATISFSLKACSLDLLAFSRVFYSLEIFRSVFLALLDATAILLRCSVFSFSSSFLFLWYMGTSIDRRPIVSTVHLAVATY